jgi:hypothetical protein
MSGLREQAQKADDDISLIQAAYFLINWKETLLVN